MKQILVLAVSVGFLSLSGCATAYHKSADGAVTFYDSSDADFSSVTLPDGVVIVRHNLRHSQAITNALKIYGVTSVVGQGISAADSAAQDAITTSNP